MSVGVFGFIPRRLTQARVGRGLTMSELEQRTGISRQSLSMYENGKSVPTPDNLRKLALELRFPDGFFKKPLQPHFDQRLPLFRAVRAVGQRDREMVQYQLDWLAELADYALGLVDVPEVNVPADLLEAMPEHPKRIDDRLIVDAAAALREHWNLGGSPIAHLMRLLERNGFIVSLVHLDLPRIDGLSMWSDHHNVPYVLLNRDLGAMARLRLTLAHELGHLVLHNRIQKGTGEGELSKLLDDQAYGFARAFLLPEESFLSDVYSTSLESLVRLKEKWKVAVSAMVIHLERLGVLTEWQYKSLMAQIGRHGWKTAEPFDDTWEPEEPILLRQAMQVIVDHGLQDADRLEHDTQIDSQSIKRFANLPDDFFGPVNYDNVIKVSFSG